MAHLTIGTLPFAISPTIVAKCFLALSAWQTQGQLPEQEEFQAFCSALMPRIMARDDDQDLARFCQRALDDIDTVQRRHALTLPPVREFRRHMRRLLQSDTYRRQIVRQADAYERWLSRLLASPYAMLAARAAAYYAEWEVLPVQPTYGAVDSFGSLVEGKYVPWLAASAVQMDVACQAPHPELRFLETLLHEQVHAVVAHRMGPDDSRRELEWLHELGAILTSQHALARAAADMGDAGLRAEVRQYLGASRDTTCYGDLATAVLRAARAPEVGWTIWTKIIALRRIPRQDYACRRVLEPLLRASGWDVALPYTYAGGAVDGLECPQERLIV